MSSKGTGLLALGRFVRRSLLIHSTASAGMSIPVPLLQLLLPRVHGFLPCNPLRHPWNEQDITAARVKHGGAGKNTVSIGLMQSEEADFVRHQRRHPAIEFLPCVVRRVDKSVQTKLGFIEHTS